MRHLSVIILMVIFTCTSCIKTRTSENQPVKTVPEVPVGALKVDNENIVISLFGTVLPTKELPESLYNDRIKKMQEARTAYEQDPKNIDKIIWYGRRLAYLGLYKEAIHIYSVGLDLDPHNYKLLRHRGHRYITIREFDNAIQDLQRAVFYSRPAENEIEQDGLPNKINQPRSNIKFNIWYHLGVAYYLKGNYDKAISAFKKCGDFADNDDLKVAVADWFYMTYQKIGNKNAAKELLEAINPDMDIVENFSYHQHLLMYKELIAPENLLKKSTEDDMINPISGYGIANWYFYNGQVETGQQILDGILKHSQWDTFGYIAAEVDKFSISGLN